MNSSAPFVAAPYKKYTIWAKAFTSKHEGNSSDTLEVRTDVAGPGRSVVGSKGHNDT
jgi:hypothetical protein